MIQKPGPSSVYDHSNCQKNQIQQKRAANDTNRNKPANGITPSVPADDDPVIKQQIHHPLGQDRKQHMASQSDAPEHPVVSCVVPQDKVNGDDAE